MKYPAGSVPPTHTASDLKRDRKARVDITETVDTPRSFRFHLEDSPVAYERMTQVSKYTDPAAIRYLSYKEFLGQAAKTAGAEIFDGPLALDVIVRVRSTKCDASNILKGVEDALNGICYHDDKQIRDTRCRIFTGYAYDIIYVHLWQQTPSELHGGDHDYKPLSGE